MNGSVIGIPTLFEIFEQLQCMKFGMGNATIFPIFHQIYFVGGIFEHSCTTWAFRFWKNWMGLLFQCSICILKDNLWFVLLFVIVFKTDKYVMHSIHHVCWILVENKFNRAKKKLLQLIATLCVGGIVSITTFLKTGELQSYS